MGPIVPPARARYLAEIAKTVRDYHATAAAQSRLARETQQSSARWRGCSTNAAGTAPRRRERSPDPLDYRAEREAWRGRAEAFWKVVAARDVARILLVEPRRHAGIS